MKKTIYLLALISALTACNNVIKKNTGNKTATSQTTGTESTSDALLDKKWKLLELNGKPIVLDTVFKKEPHLIFDKSKMAHGNAGCNNFGGVYKLEGKDGIDLSNMVATQMACPNLEVENNFMEALRNTKSYHIEGKTLMLNSVANETLAKFEETDK